MNVVLKRYLNCSYDLEKVEVSLSEGLLVLSDVELNPEQVNKHLDMESIECKCAHAKVAQLNLFINWSSLITGADQAVKLVLSGLDICFSESEHEHERSHTFPTEEGLHSNDVEISTDDLSESLLQSLLNGLSICATHVSIFWEGNLIARLNWITVSVDSALDAIEDGLDYKQSVSFSFGVVSLHNSDDTLGITGEIRGVDVECYFSPAFGRLDVSISGMDVLIEDSTRIEDVLVHKNTPIPASGRLLTWSTKIGAMNICVGEHETMLCNVDILSSGNKDISTAFSTMHMHSERFGWCRLENTTFSYVGGALYSHITSLQLVPFTTGSDGFLNSDISPTLPIVQRLGKLRLHAAIDNIIMGPDSASIVIVEVHDRIFELFSQNLHINEKNCNMSVQNLNISASLDNLFQKLDVEILNAKSIVFEETTYNDLIEDIDFGPLQNMLSFKASKLELDLMKEDHFGNSTNEVAGWISRVPPFIVLLDGPFTAHLGNLDIRGHSIMAVFDGMKVWSRIADSVVSSQIGTFQIPILVAGFDMHSKVIHTMFKDMEVHIEVFSFGDSQVAMTSKPFDFQACCSAVNVTIHTILHGENVILSAKEFRCSLLGDASPRMTARNITFGIDTLDDAVVHVNYAQLVKSKVIIGNININLNATIHDRVIAFLRSVLDSMAQPLNECPSTKVIDKKLVTADNSVQGEITGFFDKSNHFKVAVTVGECSNDTDSFVDLSSESRSENFSALVKNESFGGSIRLLSSQAIYIQEHFHAVSLINNGIIFHENADEYEYTIDDANVIISVDKECVINFSGIRSGMTFNMSAIEKCFVYAREITACDENNHLWLASSSAKAAMELRITSAKSAGDEEYDLFIDSGDFTFLMRPAVIRSLFALFRRDYSFYGAELREKRSINFFSTFIGNLHIGRAFISAVNVQITSDGKSVNNTTAHQVWSNLSLPSLDLVGIKGFGGLITAVKENWLPVAKSPANVMEVLSTGITPVRTVAQLGEGVVNLVALPILDANLISGAKMGLMSFTTNDIRPVIQSVGELGHAVVKYALRPTVVAFFARQEGSGQDGYRTIPIIVLDSSDKLFVALSQCRI